MAAVALDALAFLLLALALIEAVEAPINAQIAFIQDRIAETPLSDGTMAAFWELLPPYKYRP